LVLAFFGLTPAYRAVFMAEVHDLIYHGRGGFPYDTVYNMPVIYRRYHIQKINEYLEKKAEAEEKAMKKSSVSSNKLLARPNIPQADFTSKIKAPKK
jgi:hypothetical protein